MKRGKLMAALASATAAALIATGTFAWQQSISKVNEFWGSKDDKITLHDDFDPKINLKDVYVENSGETPVLVRVRLDEAMDLTSYTWRPQTAADWFTHKYNDGANPSNYSHVNKPGDNFHDYFTWEMGGQKYYMPANGAGQLVQDTKVYDKNDPGVAQTPLATLIDVKDYLALTDAQKAALTAWIYDTEDGYAYWSQPLAKDTATGLLLHKVTTDANLKNTDYYYAINVLVEVVDKKDIPMWTEHKPSVDGSGKLYDKAAPDSITALASLEAMLDKLVNP